MQYRTACVLDFASKVAATNDDHHDKNKQPNHNPHRDESPEIGMMFLVVEKRHGKPTAKSSAQSGHPEQDGRRDSGLSFLSLFSVYAVQNESNNVHDEQIG